MALNDAQTNEVLSQRIVQFEAEKTSHLANLVSMGALLAAFKGTPDEQSYILQIEEANKAIATLDTAIDALKAVIGQGSSAKLVTAGVSATEEAAERRVVIEEAIATTEILEGE